MKALLSLLLLIPFNSMAQIDSFNIGDFPEDWDSTRNLRGDSAQVLVWFQGHRHDNSLVYRVCYLYYTQVYPSGDTLHFLEEKFSRELPFDKWHTPTIHRHPAKGRKVINPANYRIENKRSFQHKPSLEELHNTANYWRVQMFKPEYDRLKSGGINEVLWLELFEEKPSLETFKTLMKIKN